MYQQEIGPKAPTGLASALVVLLGCHVAAALIGAVVGFAARGGVAVGPAAEVTTPDLLWNAMVVVGVAQVVLILATIVVFISWMYELAKLVAFRRPDVQRRSPRWAIWSWFIPIGNLYLPKQTANDLWKGTSQGYEHDEPPRLLHAWWGAWLVAQVLDRVSSRILDRVPDDGSDLGALRAGLMWMGVTNLVMAAAAVLALAVVRALTRRAVEWQPPLPLAPPRHGAAAAVAERFGGRERSAAAGYGRVGKRSDELDEKWQRRDSSQT